MSCGCGGKKNLPMAVTLRLEAARLTLNAAPHDFAMRAAEVYAFVIEGIDVAKLDAPDQVPIAIGDSAPAVASRNALLNAPLTSVYGLAPEIAQTLIAQGVANLGQLAQWPGVVAHRAAAEALGHYGLSHADNTDALRVWILQGPPA